MKVIIMRLMIFKEIAASLATICCGSVGVAINVRVICWGFKQSPQKTANISKNCRVHLPPSPPNNSSNDCGSEGSNSCWSDMKILMRMAAAAAVPSVHVGGWDPRSDSQYKPTGLLYVRSLGAP